MTKTPKRQGPPQVRQRTPAESANAPYVDGALSGHREARESAPPVEFYESEVEAVYAVLHRTREPMTVSGVYRGLGLDPKVQDPRVRACLRWLEFQRRIVVTPPSRERKPDGSPMTPRTYMVRNWE